ncbi:MAG TPA: dephospho-CoA kinase, partial [Terriglobales bacterium]|nr:dephospho-CoA kinase [Terriglobales bacterium]
MLKVGLTGGVACGKSTVGEMFVSLGAHLTKADEIGHQLMRPGQPVLNDIVKQFGRGILNDDGTISRPRLADLVFSTGRIGELNAIVHPAVIAAENQWMEDVFASDPKAVAIVEAALMLEAGSWKHFDRMITVVCPIDQKIERFAARHGISREAAKAEVERRMRAQASDEEKARISQYVIENCGDLADTRKRVEEIWAELKRLTVLNDIV